MPGEGICILIGASLLTAGDPERRLCLQGTIAGKVSVTVCLQGMGLHIKSVSNPDYNYQLYMRHDSPLRSVLESPGNLES